MATLADCSLALKYDSDRTVVAALGEGEEPKTPGDEPGNGSVQVGDGRLLTLIRLGSW
jgi:hypothetical protein